MPSAKMVRNKARRFGHETYKKVKSTLNGRQNRSNNVNSRCPWDVYKLSETIYLILLKCDYMQLKTMKKIRQREQKFPLPLDITISQAQAMQC